MSVSDVEEANVIRLLSRDVQATLGPGYEGVLLQKAANARTLAAEPDQYLERVVEDVQQEFHDLFIDTSWPACPRHPNHPLWLHGGYWQCERDGARIAPLGGLL